ncbi:MAG: AAA family ATPase [Rhodospirillaceae bacterium]|nr:AAA family ATPase [Rhodospirillaceae bacterium]
MDVRTYRVFMSSPGDAVAERRRIERVIDRLNGELDGSTRLQAVRWEKGFYSAHDTFQKQIPAAAECDVVVAVLRHRLGTELPPHFPRLPSGEPYPSGTAYEVLSALEARRSRDLPDIYVFRYATPPVVRLDAAEERAETESQWERLKAFFQRWFVTTDGQFVAAFQTYDGIDDLETQVDRLLRQWIAQHLARGRLIAWPVALKGSPFCGLGAFGAKHAPVFFGRARETRRAADALRDAAAGGTPFLLVIGPSGSGKSSLARAGLAPHLTAPGAVSGVDVWRVASLRPGEHPGGPLAALATRLFDATEALEAEEEGRAPALPELAQGPYATPADLAGLLAHGDDSAVLPVLAALDRVAAAERTAGGYDRQVAARLLLIVDQLDELFAADVPPDARQQFAAVLVRLAASGRVWVVATLRADFYEAAVAVPGLLTLKSAGATFDLQPPGPAELAEIVRAPAAAADLVYEIDDGGRRLDERVLADADQPDMLPLLQFTLNRLFEARQEVEGEIRLTHAACDAIGGLDGAVDQEAEKALAGLGEAELRSLPRLLRALVAPAGDAERRDRLTIRSVALSDFADDGPSKRLVAALVEARILLSEGAASRSTVRLAHERVISSWKRARDLVAANLDFFRIRQEVEDACARWQSSGRRRDRLIAPGIALEEAAGLRRRFGGELDSDTNAFVRVSSDRAHLRQRLTTAASVVFAVLAVVATGLGLWAYDQQQEAVRQQEWAETQTEIAERAAQEAAEARDLAEAAADAANAAADAEASARRQAEAAQREAELQAARAEAVAQQLDELLNAIIVSE